jgi:acyl-CoA synthetase (AMP-forming)/AMP-acid ligase II
MLKSMPPVRERIVLAREDEPGGNRLVAYVVLKKGFAETTLELQRFLKRRLRAYLVPSSFVILESLPLSANGKVNRQALPAPSDYGEPGRAVRGRCSVANACRDREAFRA